MDSQCSEDKHENKLGRAAGEGYGKTGGGGGGAEEGGLVTNDRNIGIGF